MRKSVRRIQLYHNETDETNGADVTEAERYECIGSTAASYTEIRNATPVALPVSQRNPAKVKGRGESWLQAFVSSWPFLLSVSLLTEYSVPSLELLSAFPLFISVVLLKLPFTSNTTRVADIDF